MTTQLIEATPAIADAAAPLSAMLSSGTQLAFSKAELQAPIAELDDTAVLDAIADLEREAGASDLSADDRNDIVADLGAFTHEAQRRGLMAADPELPVGPDEDDTNPPIAEREDSTTAADVAAGDTEIAEHQEPRDDGIQSAAPAATVTGPAVEMLIDDIYADPAQARDEGADEDLAPSIIANGVLQPIVVRPHPDGDPLHWMIVDGERRWRGAKKAGRYSIPARSVSDAEDEGDRLLHQVLFNDGKRLKPMEEARSWKRIMTAKGWKIQQLAAALGRPKSTVSDRLALLDAPAPFQELFITGVLSASAAPIVREYRDVPESILKKLVDNAKQYAWKEAIESGVPVPVKLVEQGLQDEMEQNDVGLQPLDDKDVAAQYTGPTCTIKGEKYATDTAAYDAIVDARRAAAHPAAPQKRTPSAEDLKYREKQRAEQKAREKKMQQRLAQFDALSAKLPTTAGLDGRWMQFVVRLLLKHLSTDDQRNAVKALGITPTKKGGAYGGYDFPAAIESHAADLTPGKLQRLVIQLLLAPDVYVSPNYDGGAKRLAEAAQLLGIDLGKVKAPDPAAAKVPGTALAPIKKRKAPARVKAKKPVATKVAAKKAPKRRAIADFMKPQQPDAALAAIVGEKPLPRTEVTKKLWAYIKKHELQDKKERRMIAADAKLKPVFGGKAKVSMFEMTKLVNKHLTPTKA